MPEYDEELNLEYEELDLYENLPDEELDYSDEEANDYDIEKFDEYDIDYWNGLDY